MLKRNFKLIAFFAIIMLFLATTFSFAENDITTTSTDDINTTSEDINTTSEDSDVTDENSNAETVQKDVYIFEDNVTVDYIVEGNLFVFGSNVTINEYVEGDVFVMGSDVILNSEVISGNVFSIGQKLTVNSQLYDLYAAGNVVTIGENARIYRDAHIAASKVNLYGAIVRNADLAFGNISFDSGKYTGIIYGNLRAETNLDQSAFDGYVYGSVDIHQPTTYDFNFNREYSKNIIGSSIMAIVFALIMFYLFSKLLPNFTEKTSEEVMSKKVLTNFGVGLLALILIPIISIILMILIVTIPFAFILLAAYILALALSNVIITIAISKFIIKKYNLSTVVKQLCAIILVSLALSIIGIVPFINGLVGFLKVTIALGLVVRTVFSNISNNKIQTAKVEPVENNKIEE